MAPTKMILAAVLAVACFVSQAAAQIPSGQNSVCCAFIFNSANRWQLVCNRPAGIPGAQPFPAGTIISGIVANPQIAQCVGRFPFPNPFPYRLPPTGVQLFSTPNGLRCAGRFNTFYQGLGPDGGFVIQCTNPAASAVRVAQANAFTAAQPANPAAVASITDGYPVTNATGIDAIIPATAGAVLP